MTLVLTPSPKPSESLLGYVLRISEANGYPTPWHILKYAGIEQQKMRSAAIPLHQIAKTLGRSPQEFEPISYAKEVGGQRIFQLLGHNLGAGLNQGLLRLVHPALCPDCILEKGYIDAFFDLSAAIACPTHTHLLVTRCPSCSGPISWFRPGLLTCQCGASLAKANTTTATPEIVNLMRLLWNKLHRIEVNSDDNPLELPIKYLRDLNLRSLLKLFSIGKLTVSSIKSTSADLLTTSANILSNWPRGFYEFLNGLRQTRDAQGTSFRKRFEDLNNGFFRGKHRVDFLWLREEFVRYGLSYAEDSIVDDKLLRPTSAERRFVSQSELARRLDISPVTLRSWAAKGFIDIQRIQTPTQHRYIADSSMVTLPVPTPSDKEILEQRAAAAFLELPVSVLTHLRQLGNFPFQHRLRHQRGFHRSDLQTFRRLLLAASPRLADETTNRIDTVSLADVLAEYRFHSSSAKTEFLLDYLKGAIPTIGRSGDSLANILFYRKDVLAHVSASRSKAAGDTLTQAEAAHLIDCDMQAILGLINKGLIASQQGREGLRVTRSSAIEFSKQYVALSTLARAQGSSSRRLMRLCCERSIPMVTVARSGKGGVPFIKHVALNELL